MLVCLFCFWNFVIQFVFDKKNLEYHLSCIPILIIKLFFFFTFLTNYKIVWRSYNISIISYSTWSLVGYFYCVSSPPPQPPQNKSHNTWSWNYFFNNLNTYCKFRVNVPDAKFPSVNLSFVHLFLCVCVWFGSIKYIRSIPKKKNWTKKM